MDAELLIKLVTGAGGFYTLYKILGFIFGSLEKMWDDEQKKMVGEKLSNINIENLFYSFGSNITDLINFVFSHKHFSLKCFWKSLLASFLFVLIFHLWFFFFYSNIFRNKIYGEWSSFFVNLLIFFILYNLVDFFLLWKTRKLLVYISKERQKLTSLILLGDSILTFLFASIKFFVLMIVLERSFKIDFDYYFKYVIHIKYPPAPTGSTNDPKVIPSLFFWSTFFYSGFLWLYFISIVLAKRLRFMDKFKVWFQKFFSIKNNPIEFVKVIFGVVLFTIFIGIVFFKYVV